MSCNINNLFKMQDARSLAAKSEASFIASYEAKIRSTKGSRSRKYLPLQMQRKKYGVINVEKQVMTKKYYSIKEGDGQWQAAYIVRDKLGQEPRLYGELLRYDKELKRKVVNRKDLSSLSLKQLSFFSDIQQMFDNIKEISREESLVAFKTNGTKVPEDIEEYQFNDGYAVYEPVEYITYRAMFGSRDIVYTVNDKTNRIFNVMSYSAYEMAYNARNKAIAERNSMRAYNDRFEVMAEAKADAEIFISKDVYGEQNIMMW